MRTPANRPVPRSMSTASSSDGSTTALSSTAVPQWHLLGENRVLITIGDDGLAYTVAPDSTIDGEPAAANSTISGTPAAANSTIISGTPAANIVTSGSPAHLLARAGLIAGRPFVLAPDGTRTELPQDALPAAVFEGVYSTSPLSPWQPFNFNSTDVFSLPDGIYTHGTLADGTAVAWQHLPSASGAAMAPPPAYIVEGWEPFPEDATWPQPIPDIIDETDVNYDVMSPAVEVSSSNASVSEMMDEHTRDPDSDGGDISGEERRQRAWAGLRRHMLGTDSNQDGYNEQPEGQQES